MSAQANSKRLNSAITDMVDLLQLMQKHNNSIDEGYKTPKEEAEVVLRILPLLEQTVKLVTTAMEHKIRENMV
jgi:hypothetical protein